MSARLFSLLPVIFFLASLGLQERVHVEGATCLVAPNSTSPSGYFVFYSTWFPTPKYSVNVGFVNTSNVYATCEAKCKSKYGFFIRPNGLSYRECFCLKGNPDYTRPSEIWIDAYYAKKCPKVKGAPPPPFKPGPPPPAPPPPQIPKGCRVAYNSSFPSGYFFFSHVILSGRPPYIVNTTNRVDVWPEGAPRCERLCKRYKWGFVMLSEKYGNNNDCACLLSPMTYKFGISLNAFFVSYYSKSCPSKKGGHPPGVGHHPPGVGNRI